MKSEILDVMSAPGNTRVARSASQTKASSVLISQVVFTALSSRFTDLNPLLSIIKWDISLQFSWIEEVLSG